MKAYEKRKIVRQSWAKQMKSGKTNNASDGSWGNNTNHTISQMTQAGATHNR